MWSATAGGRPGSSDFAAADAGSAMQGRPGRLLDGLLQLSLPMVHAYGPEVHRWGFCSCSALTMQLGSSTVNALLCKVVLLCCGCVTASGSSSLLTWCLDMFFVLLLFILWCGGCVSGKDCIAGTWSTSYVSNTEDAGELVMKEELESADMPYGSGQASHSRAPRLTAVTYLCQRRGCSPQHPAQHGLGLQCRPAEGVRLGQN